MSVECLQIRPGPRPLVHFTGEESHRMVFLPRALPAGMQRGAWDWGARCALHCLPAPGLRRKETAGPTLAPSLGGPFSS